MAKMRNERMTLLQQLMSQVEIAANIGPVLLVSWTWSKTS